MIFLGFLEAGLGVSHGHTPTLIMHDALANSRHGEVPTNHRALPEIRTHHWFNQHHNPTYPSPLNLKHRNTQGVQWWWGRGTPGAGN